MIRALVVRLVDLGGRRPLVVLGIALALMAAAWSYASKLELRSDFLELLPRDSPGFKAFEHQLGRVGGGATLVVVVESPDRKSNELFIDKLAERIEVEAKARPGLVAYVETGTKDVRQFYQDNKWLYADLKELEDADRDLDNQIAIKSGLVEDLDAPDEPASPPSTADAGGGGKSTAVSHADGGADAAGGGSGSGKVEKKSALGLDEHKDAWDKQAKKHDDFPTGYFTTEKGTMHALRIVSTSSGTGDAGGDKLLDRLKVIVAELSKSGFHPETRVGFAGDIPNAVAEKESLVSEAAMATGVALVLILGGIAFFYRSPWAIPLVGFPPLFGVGCAYAFATWKYGFVNSSGAFLGAIILGNGVNYPIVLYSRYREFRARGMPADEARREAVWNAFRAELVGASVAAIAYGSLTITRFRGFSQFGVIGFVGMLLVWISMIPCVPAMIVLVERLQERLPSALRQTAPRLEGDGSRGMISRVLGDITARYPWIFVGLAFVFSAASLVKVPHFLMDPWEYNFAKLGSRASTHGGGAGEWSNKAEEVFGGKMNVAGALMLADTPEQTPLLAKKILANDAADKQGSLISEVSTVDDLLPGDVALQEQKLEVLNRIRDRLTPRVLHDLEEDERKRVLDLKPPETLRLLAAKDLPPLLRRRFQENNGTVGTVFYVKYRNISLSDGHNLLRIANSTDNVELPDGSRVLTASRSTIFAEMIRSMERDGPLATGASFVAVAFVVLFATSNRRGTIAVLASLVLGVLWMLGWASWTGEKLNFLNFIALPITFGIGSEYPFNIYDRSRLLGGDVTQAVKLHTGAVALCSYTTVIGYGSLVMADNQALQSFGRLSIVGELSCLYAALLFLPSLLHLIGAHRPRPASVIQGDAH